MAAHTFIVFTNFYIISEAKLFTLYSVQRCTTFGKMSHMGNHALSNPMIPFTYSLLITQQVSTINFRVYSLLQGSIMRDFTAVTMPRLSNHHKNTLKNLK